MYIQQKWHPPQAAEYSQMHHDTCIGSLDSWGQQHQTWTEEDLPGIMSGIMTIGVATPFD